MSYFSCQRKASLGAVVLWLSLLLPGQAGEPPEKARAAIPIADIKRNAPVDFEKDILPLLKNNCLACHNQTTTKADLILETPQTILKGGETGPLQLNLEKYQGRVLKKIELSYQSGSWFRGRARVLIEGQHG